MSDAGGQPQRRSGSPSPAGESEGSALLRSEEASGLSDGGEDEGPETVSAETQTAALADAAVQYEPPGAGADSTELADQLQSADLAEFLASAAPRCEAALQQNELLDALGDELAALADEDGGEPAGAGASAGHSAVAGLAELHSFSDLLHSKGRTLQAVAWHPGRRGVVAVACTQNPQPQPQQQHAGGSGAASAAPAATVATVTGGRQPGATQAPLAPGRQEVGAASAAAGPAAALRQPPPGCILVWTHADAIHPEAVLQPPAEALTFAFHPIAPHGWLAVGLATGQVALFNLLQAAPAGPAGGGGATTGGAPASQQQSQQKPPPQQQRKDKQGSEGDREEGSRAAVLLPAFVSSPDASHHAAVTDLRWLPGAVVTKEGGLEACAGAGSADAAGSGAGTARPATASAAAADACTLFATTAADGSLLLWDMRISTRLRRGAKDEEAPEWKPALALAPPKDPLMATRFCPDPRAGVGRFIMGSLDGELAVVDVAPSLSEQGKAAANTPDWVLSAAQQAAGHTGRVLALAFSPFFSDTLLVVGDSGFVVWRVHNVPPRPPGGDDMMLNGAAAEGAGAGEQHGCLAVFESPFCADALYTCGCWSPSKPGVVILGRGDGRLEAWDLLDRSHQAAMVAPVAPCALTALAPSPVPPGGHGARAALQVLAVSDSAGTLRLLELPRALRRRGHAEVKAMAALLGREQDRLAEVARRAEARAAEARAAADRRRAEETAAALNAARKQQQEAAAKAAGQAVEGEEDEGAAAERRYLELEAAWREKLLGPASARTGGEAPVAAA